MKALVQDKQFVTEEIFILWLEIDNIKKDPVPGQFFMLGTGVTFLKRPFTPCDVSGNLIRFAIKIKGRGTKWLSQRNKGDSIEITGPWGNGVKKIKGKRIGVVGGGTGVAPLLYLIKFFEDKKFYSFLGAKTERELLFLEEFEFFSEKVVYATQDGTKGKKGLIVDFLKDDFDEVYACGPWEMLSAVKKRIKHGKKYGFIEKEIWCGAGLCMGCGVKREDGSYIRICSDGPVISLDEVKFEP